MTKKARLRKAASGRAFNRLLNTGVGVISFLGSFTAKDRGAYTGTMMQKGQTLINNVMGRLFGVNPAPGGAKFSQITSLNTAAILTSPGTKIGLGAIGYGILGGLIRKVPVAGKYIKLPMYGKIGRLGGITFGASFLGEILDAPTGGTMTAINQGSSVNDSRYQTTPGGLIQ